MTDNFFKKNRKIFFVGIKGTGMSALAELLHNAGVPVSGSDTGETFYTETALKSLNIPYFETFDAAHIEKDIDLVVYSAAYSPETNPELLEAVRRGVPIMKYTDALGEYSASFDSSGVAGVHGKTTTTALTGALLQGAGVPAQILAGSAVTSFNGRSTLSLGNKYFVAETCEYRRHFLSFHPKRIILTGVESDHQDYYPTYESIRDAFVEYAEKLPDNGELIFCADDEGACEAADILKKRNKGKKEIRFTPYGFTAQGRFQITVCSVKDEKLFFTLAGFEGQFTLQVPGKHNALNASAALALVSSLVTAEFGGWNEERLCAAKEALAGFRGSKRRSEILGETGGVLFMDDYAHHPTAIKTTLAGIRDFYPNRRLIVSFMSHTYTRTAALLEDFAHSLLGADILILHKIYASAREIYNGGVSGKTLFERVKELDKNKEVFYAEEPLDALEFVKPLLKPGDLFLTMGAGDNWKLGDFLLKESSG